ncbi:hypothetical protein M3J09_013785 [Ascochyta lentis]
MGLQLIISFNLIARWYDGSAYPERLILPQRLFPERLSCVALNRQPLCSYAKTLRASNSLLVARTRLLLLDKR